MRSSGRGPAPRSIVSTSAYWVRVFAFPLVCLVLMFVAFAQARSTDQTSRPRERIEQRAPVTPVLSARRLPSVLALPGHRQQVIAPIQQVLAQLPGDSTCLVVTNARAVPLYQYNPGLALAPASTMKLLTAYGVLATLGGDKTFQTYVATDAAIQNGIVQGNVWLIGTGDPVLTTDDYANSFVEQPQVRTRFEGLVEQLKAAGISRIRGNVIADETRYDNVRYVRSWPSRFLSQAVAGPQSAIGLNRGFTAYPASGQQFAGSGARTASADPARSTADRFIALARAAGITIDGRSDAGAVPQSPNFLAKVESPPLRDITAYMLRNSDNTVAELLLKELGMARIGKGTTQAGAEALTTVLVERQWALPGTVVVDGSGLDLGNRVPCATVLAVLNGVGRQSDIGGGMAVAGQTGTLFDRMLGTAAVGRVHAKTGTLDTASALAGFIDTTKGDIVGFAVIVNAEGADAFKAVEDQLAVSLVDFPSGPTNAELGPVAPG